MILLILLLAILSLAIGLGFLCAVQLTRHLERQPKEETYLSSPWRNVWGVGLLLCCVLCGAIVALVWVVFVSWLTTAALFCLTLMVAPLATA